MPHPFRIPAVEHTVGQGPSYLVAGQVWCTIGQLVRVLLQVKELRLLPVVRDQLPPVKADTRDSTQIGDRQYALPNKPPQARRSRLGVRTTGPHSSQGLSGCAGPSGRRASWAARSRSRLRRLRTKAAQVKGRLDRASPHTPDTRTRAGPGRPPGSVLHPRTRNRPGATA